MARYSSASCPTLRLKSPPASVEVPDLPGNPSKRPARSAVSFSFDVSLLFAISSTVRIRSRLTPAGKPSDLCMLAIGTGCCMVAIGFVLEDAPGLFWKFRADPKRSPGRAVEKKGATMGQPFSFRAGADRVRAEFRRGFCTESTLRTGKRAANWLRFAVLQGPRPSNGGKPARAVWSNRRRPPSTTRRSRQADSNGNRESDVWNTKESAACFGPHHFPCEPCDPCDPWSRIPNPMPVRCP